MDERAAAEIELASGSLVSLVERHTPELLQSLTLVGSAVDGDFRPGKSDLDFVAVLRQAPGEAELEALGIIHRLYASDPTLARLDGIWITPDELAAGPDQAAPGPATESGVFRADAQGNRNPVAWFTLRDAGRTVLGTVDRAGIWRDEARLRSWVRQNVEDYWVPWHAGAARLLTGRGLAMLGRDGPMWGVLGISRMHATLATGAILSKAGAGEHALSAFGDWRIIVEECLANRAGRRGPLAGAPWRRRRLALDFVAMAIAAVRATDTA